MTQITSSAVIFQLSVSKYIKNMKKRQVKITSWNGLFYGLMIVLILNSFVFPYVLNKKIIETDYGTFISNIEKGNVQEVSIDQNCIYFATKEDGKQHYFKTGAVDDPGLVERLLKASSNNESGKIVFNKQIPKDNSPLTDFFLMWIMPALVFYLIWRGMSHLMQKKMGAASGNFMSFGNGGAKIYADSEVNTTFADVAGQEEAKEGLSEIVDFLHNPAKYASIGAKLPKGALLVGPPGTGKTLIARTVAGEAKVPFFAISESDFVQMFVGMGAAKVRDLFMQAKEKAPCIIFIDEIDAIGKKRNSGPMGGNDEREQTLNQLLTEMDGFDGQKGVVILAATNRPESLDNALLRPGRFDRRIIMNLPDLEGRKAILNVHLKSIKHDSIDVGLIARATAGSSGAELANIVNEAALRAVRNGKKRVSTSDLEESVETVIAGAQKKGMVISEREKKIIAYHEIGHALVAAMQTHSAPVHKITIIPRTSGALGYTMQVDSQEQFLLSKQELLDKITTYTGGRAAEEVVFDIITTGASNDIEQATRLARAMVSRYGMSEKYGMMALETVNNAYLGGDTTLSCSPATASDIDSEVREIIETAYHKATGIIKANRRKMDELAEFLLEKETITGDEFMEILNRQ